ncbi:MAG TPA: hypothetical protein VK509_05190 [Polyangiales bacterium]|nr:hypothetical protein [Polyangiales bacterium]
MAAITFAHSFAALVMLIACAPACTGLKSDGDDDDDREAGSEAGEPSERDSGDAPRKDAGVDSGRMNMPRMDAGPDASPDARGPGPDDGATASDTGTVPGDATQPAESRCASDHGGCDQNATCTDDPNDPSAAPSCACMPGFAGNGQSCSAVLSALTLSVGTLQPALGPDTTSYTIAVPIDTERLTFTPTAPAPATIVLNDDAIVASGSAWQSPLLELGFNSFSATIQHSGHPDRDYVFNVIRGRQEAYLKGSAQLADDFMGWDVDIDGNTVVVGAPGDLDSGPARAGSAYVFVRNGASWEQQARLAGDINEAGDFFGASVAVAGDTIAVGASGEGNAAPDVTRRGAVYVFTRSGGTWTKQARLQASNGEAYDFFGQDVSLADDTLAVSAFYEDSSQQGVSTTAPTTNGADASGAAYIFTRTSGSWTQRMYIKASQSAAGDEFGTTLALSRDPTGALYTLVVGAPVDAVGATNYAGSVSIFRGSGASWTEEAVKTSSAPESYGAYGQSVAIDGDSIVVGAAREGTKGAFYVYHRSSGAWQPRGPFSQSAGSDYDYYGGAVAISGSMIAIGASEEDSSGTGVTASADELATNSGAIYLYSFANDFITLTRSYYVKSERVDPDDSFGTSIAMSGTAVVVGARREASNAVTVGGDATNNAASASGAAYIVR